MDYRSGGKPTIHWESIQMLKCKQLGVLFFLRKPDFQCGIDILFYHANQQSYSSMIAWTLFLPDSKTEKI